MAQRKRKGLVKRKARRKPSSPRKNQRKRRKVPRPAAIRPRAATTRRKPKRTQKRKKLGARLELAVRELNHKRSLTATARLLGISTKGLREQLTRKRLLKRKGKRWIFQDDLLRRVTVTTRGRSRVLIVRGYKQARLIGKYSNAVGQFVRTNDIQLLKPFIGRTMQAANGRRYLLETNPNVLHRIAAMDTPRFHEIYEITSNT